MVVVGAVAAAADAAAVLLPPRDEPHLLRLQVLLPPLDAPVLEPHFHLERSPNEKPPNNRLDERHPTGLLFFLEKIRPKIS